MLLLLYPADFSTGCGEYLVWTFSGVVYVYVQFWQTTLSIHLLVWTYETVKACILADL